VFCIDFQISRLHDYLLIMSFFGQGAQYGHRNQNSCYSNTNPDHIRNPNPNPKVTLKSIVPI